MDHFPMYNDLWSPFSTSHQTAMTALVQLKQQQQKKAQYITLGSKEICMRKELDPALGTVSYIPACRIRQFQDPGKREGEWRNQVVLLRYDVCCDTHRVP